MMIWNKPVETLQLPLTACTCEFNEIFTILSTWELRNLILCSGISVHDGLSFLTRWRIRLVYNNVDTSELIFRSEFLEQIF